MLPGASAEGQLCHPLCHRRSPLGFYSINCLLPTPYTHVCTHIHDQMLWVVSLMILFPAPGRQLMHSGGLLNIC